MFVGALGGLLGADPSAGNCVLVLGILHPLGYNNFIILHLVIIFVLRLRHFVVIAGGVGLGRELVVRIGLQVID